MCSFVSAIFDCLVAKTVKNPPAMQETWVRSLGWEEPLEEGMATHPTILSWRIPIDRGAWWATVHGAARRHDWVTKHPAHLWLSGTLLYLSVDSLLLSRVSLYGYSTICLSGYSPFDGLLDWFHNLAPVLLIANNLLLNNIQILNISVFKAFFSILKILFLY